MTVLILGGGVMQLPAIAIAREMGWAVAVADANAAAPGAALADRFFPVDLKDREGLEVMARGLKADGGLDAVFTAGTDFSASVAWVAERLGLPGVPFRTALRASDKIEMRRALAAHGVSSPRYVEVARGAHPRVLAAEAGLDFPLVVKPTDSMGARGCRAVFDPDTLDDAVAVALEHSRSGRAIVEEYIDGPEFSIDALVVEGEVWVRGIADRHIAFSPYFVELGHTMPSAAEPAVLSEVLAVFTAGVRAIGIDGGAAKGDMKFCPARGGAVVGEIAARLSGGYMSGWTYPYASGIEVTREALQLAAGRLPERPRGDRGWVSAERAFLSIPGRFHSLLGERQARCHPCVKELFVRARGGDRLVFPANNVEKCGNLITQAADRRQAVGSAEEALRGLLVRLEAPDPDTEAFLRGEGRIHNPDGSAWPPEAFDLGGEELRALGEMPQEMGPIDGGPDAEAPALSVTPWPAAEIIALRDWSGRSLSESAALALGFAGVGFGRDGRRVLAGRFWRAVVRGGAQAGLYVLECAAREAR